MAGAVVAISADMISYLSNQGRKQSSFNGGGGGGVKSCQYMMSNHLS